MIRNLRSCQRRFPSIQEKFEEHDEVTTMGVAVLCLVFIEPGTSQVVLESWNF